jgi:hypothetical protein
VVCGIFFSLPAGAYLKITSKTAVEFVGLIFSADGMYMFSGVSLFAVLGVSSLWGKVTFYLDHQCSNKFIIFTTEKLESLFALFNGLCAISFITPFP